MSQKIIYESTDPRFLSDLQHSDLLNHGMTAQHSASNILVCRKFCIFARSSEHCLSCGKAKVELGDTWICSFALNGSPKKVSKLDSPFSLLCPGLTDKSEQGEGHQCLLNLTSQWAGTHCPGTAGGPCWLFCLLFYLVRDNRSICSVTLTQAMQG